MNTAFDTIALTIMPWGPIPIKASLLKNHSHLNHSIEYNLLKRISCFVTMGPIFPLLSLHPLIPVIALLIIGKTDAYINFNLYTHRPNESSAFMSKTVKEWVWKLMRCPVACHRLYKPEE